MHREPAPADRAPLNEASVTPFAAAAAAHPLRRRSPRRSPRADACNATWARRLLHHFTEALPAETHPANNPDADPDAPFRRHLDQLATVDAFRRQVYDAATPPGGGSGGGGGSDPAVAAWGRCQRAYDGRGGYHDPQTRTRPRIACRCRLCPHCWAASANALRAQVLQRAARYPSHWLPFVTHEARRVVNVRDRSDAQARASVRTAVDQIRDRMAAHAGRLGDGLAYVSVYADGRARVVLRGHLLGVAEHRPDWTYEENVEADARAVPDWDESGRFAEAPTYHAFRSTVDGGYNTATVVSWMLTDLLKYPPSLARVSPGSVWDLQRALYRVRTHAWLGRWADLRHLTRDAGRGTLYARADPEWAAVHHFYASVVARAVDRNDPVVTARDLIALNDRMVPDARMAALTLKLMADDGLGVLHTPGRTGRPGRPRGQVLVLNAGYFGAIRPVVIDDPQPVQRVRQDDICAG